MYLYNTFFETDGILRAVELYAQTAGSIQIKVFSFTSCSSTYSRIKNPTLCGDLKTSSQHDCVSNFKKSNQKCENEPLGQTFLNGLSSFTSVKTETVTVTAGYNLIKPFGGNYEVKQGWFLGIVQSSANICFSSETTLSDYAGALTINGTFYVRAFLSKPIPFTSLNLYGNIGPYIMTSNILQPVTSPGFLMSRSFYIYQRITELSAFTTKNQCKQDIECVFSATTLTGSNITYEWRLPSVNISTNVPELRHVFRTSGVMDLVLFAYNPVSNATYLFSVKILVVVRKPRLSLNNSLSIESTSILGNSVDFVFTLEAGLGYSCIINFGDMSVDNILSFNDLYYNRNNTIFSHLFNQEGEFKVSIYCENSISNDSYSFQHIVQFEILNLRLTKWFSYRNTPFNVEFALDAGTSPQFQLSYDGQTDAGVTWNSLTKMGSGSSRTATASGLYPVNLTVWNKVSRVVLIQNFEIGAKIRNPQFLMTNTNSFSPGFFRFGTSLNFVVKMEDGANVRLRFFFGDQNDLSIPSREVNTTGDWNSDYSISYTHADPGDFGMYVIVSNAFDTFVLNQTVSIVTDVNNLIPGLAENPVVFSPLGSFAYFMFSFAGISKSGSHASVTLWPGDLFNQSFGPYKIGMDFKLNATVNRLMYRYLAEGTYKAVFLVENMLGSKFYDITFSIKQGVYGLFINFDPVVRAGSIIKIATYLVQGENVTYSWTFDNQEKTARRLGNFFIPFLYLFLFIDLTNLQIHLTVDFILFRNTQFEISILGL